VLHQQKVDATYLASTNVGTPDPRKPPNGQMIVAEWWIPKKVLDCAPVLRLHILFRNYTQDCVEFPIRSRAGYETYSVLNEDFKETKGLLAYKAEIVTCDGDVYCKWKHQFWVQLITIGEASAEISSSVIEKSKQGSVIETPLCKSLN